MTAPKFTAGPWHWDGLIGRSGLRYAGEKEDTDGCVMCYAPYEGLWFSAYGQHGVDEANAHLIAAAPELYEALSLASRHSKRWPHSWNEADVAVLESALAKARGES